MVGGGAGGKKKAPPLFVQSGHEEIVTFIELLLAGSFKVGGKGNTAAHHIKLISSVVSLVPLQVRDPFAVFPLDYSLELLEFNSFAKAMNRSLRNVWEMALLGLALDEFRRSDDTDADIQTTDSFIRTGFRCMAFSDVGDTMGILFLEFLNMVNSGMSSAEAYASVEGQFEGYCDFSTQFKTGASFWLAAVDVVNHLATADVISKEFAGAFNDATRWIDQRLSEINWRGA